MSLLLLTMLQTSIALAFQRDGRNMSTMTTVNMPSQCMLRHPPKRQFTSSIIKFSSPLGSSKALSKAFGLKASASSRTSMAVYKVKLIGPDYVIHTRMESELY